MFDQFKADNVDAAIARLDKDDVLFSLPSPQNDDERKRLSDAVKRRDDRRNKAELGTAAQRQAFINQFAGGTPEQLSKQAQEAKEADQKKAMLDRWTKAGGRPDEFEAAWDEIRRRMLIDAVLAKDEDTAQRQAQEAQKIRSWT